MTLQVSERPIGSKKEFQRWAILRITRDNLHRVARWCGGSVRYSQSYDCYYIDFRGEILMPGEHIGKLAGGDFYILNSPTRDEMFGDRIIINS